MFNKKDIGKKFGKKIDNNYPDFFEPKPKSYNQLNNLHTYKLDWTHDFSEKNDVVEDSIKLALYTLAMSKSEFNSFDISSLKNQKKFDFSS